MFCQCVLKIIQLQSVKNRPHGQVTLTQRWYQFPHITGHLLKFLLLWSTVS